MKKMTLRVPCHSSTALVYGSLARHSLTFSGLPLVLVVCLRERASYPVMCFILSQ